MSHSVVLPTGFAQVVDPLWTFLAVNEQPKTSDIIFVFGSQDLSVPLHAASLYRAGYAQAVLVSGHYGRMTRRVFNKPEALVFKNLLISNGVPSEMIVTECSAENTLENVKYGLAALRRRCLPVATAILVAKPFVMRRCAATFARYAPQIRVRCCPPTNDVSSSVDRPPQAFALRLVAELNRLDRYGEAGDIQPQTVPVSVRDTANRIMSVVSHIEDND